MVTYPYILIRLVTLHAQASRSYLIGFGVCMRNVTCFANNDHTLNTRGCFNVLTLLSAPMQRREFEEKRELNVGVH